MLHLIKVCESDKNNKEYLGKNVKKKGKKCFSNIDLLSTVRFVLSLTVYRLYKSFRVNRTT